MATDESFTYQAKNIFPEYYLINVKRFEDVIQSPLDEWIYFLKHSAVRNEFNAKNIDKAAKKLAVLKMTTEERSRYDNYIKAAMIEHDVLATARQKGKLEGKLEERLRIVQSLLDVITDDELLALKTGLSVEELRALRVAKTTS